MSTDNENSVSDNGIKRKLDHIEENGNGVAKKIKLVKEQEAGVLLFSGLTNYEDRNDPKLTKNPSVIWSPQRFETLENIRIKNISSGPVSYFFYAVTENGKVYSCGLNQKGQLGLGDCKTQTNPMLMQALSGYNVVAVATGRQHGLILTDAGDVFACGDNSSGQCGIGNKKDIVTEPTKLDYSGPPIVEVACGAEFSLILNEDGEMYSFGHPLYGQLGNGSESKELVRSNKEVFHFTYSPTLITSFIEKDPDCKDIISHGQPQVVKIACGVNHSCAIDDKQRVFTWGFGGYGRLGHSDTRNEFVPRLMRCWYRITGRSDGGILDVACGGQFTLVKTIAAKCTFMFGQYKISGEANMYPKMVDDLQGWNVRCIACNQYGYIACADDSVIASQPSPAYGTMGMGEKVKSSAAPKIVSTLDNLYCIKVGLGLMHSLYIVRDESDREKATIKKFPTMKLEDVAVKPAADNKSKKKTTKGKKKK